MMKTIYPGERRSFPLKIAGVDLLVKTVTLYCPKTARDRKLMRLLETNEAYLLSALIINLHVSVYLYTRQTSVWFQAPNQLWSDKTLVSIIYWRYRDADTYRYTTNGRCLQNLTEIYVSERNHSNAIDIISEYAACTCL